MKGRDHQNHKSTQTYPTIRVHNVGVGSAAFRALAKLDPERLNTLQTIISRETARPCRRKNWNAPKPSLPSIMYSPPMWTRPEIKNTVLRKTKAVNGLPLGQWRTSVTTKMVHDFSGCEISSV